MNKRINDEKTTMDDTFGYTAQKFLKWDKDKVKSEFIKIL